MLAFCFFAFCVGVGREGGSGSSSRGEVGLGPGGDILLLFIFHLLLSL